MSEQLQGKAVTFCTALPVLVEQSEVIKLRTEALAEEDVVTKAQDLLVLLKVFNLSAGVTAPMLARKAKANSEGVLDQGSMIAAALTKFIEIENQINNNIGKPSALGGTPHLMNSSAWQAVRQVESNTNRLAYELLESQPFIDHIKNLAAAKKVEQEYGELVEIWKSIILTLDTKTKEPWLATFLAQFKAELQATATILDNLGAYLQEATPAEIAGAATTAQRNDISQTIDQITHSTTGTVSLDDIIKSGAHVPN